MRQRPAARLLVLDHKGRVLLFRFVHREGALAGQDYRATPGGGLETGETFEQAAIRELRKETGIEISQLDHPISIREFELELPNGERVVAIEQFFVVQAGNVDLSRGGWSSQEHHVMAEHRWWSEADLLETQAVVWPPNIFAMLKGAGGR